MSAAIRLIGLLALLMLSYQVTAVGQATPPPVLNAPAPVATAPASETLAPPAGEAKPAFTAYLAESSGNNVNIRSGPAEVYYKVGQLSMGERFIVVDVIYGVKNWAKIKPTPQCFSYIAKELVNLVDYPAGTSGANAPLGQEIVLGEVTGDNVRIRAGSILVPPAHASEVQTLLAKGAMVKIIGQRDDYYKIICPPDCYFWVSLDFVKRIGPVDEETATELAHLVGQNVLNPPPPQEKPAVVKTIRMDRQNYLKAVEMIEQLQSVPILQRDFGPLKAAIDELLKSESSLIQRHARGLATLTLRMEEAQQVVVRAQQQDQQLMASLGKINEKLETLAAVSPNDSVPSAITVQGTLGYSAIFTATNQNRRFTISDNEEKIISYAVSDNPAINLNDWIGKRVSMTGRSEYDSFSKIHILHVQNLVEMPGTK